MERSSSDIFTTKAEKSGKIILVPKTLSIYSRNKKINDLDELSNGYVYSENDGEVVGVHVGAHFYTIGQLGISVGGTKDLPYVIALDTKKNIIYVGEGIITRFNEKSVKC